MRYDDVIEEIFRRLVEQYGAETDVLPFDKAFLDELSGELGIKNVPDIIYSYRSGRRNFPPLIAGSGYWVIIGRGRGKYAFERMTQPVELNVPQELEAIPLPDATPDIVLRFAKGDEQSMLVQIRYNRLVDIFTGLTAYHLQSHVRAYVDEVGQIEVDDLYVGV
ncbi:MAG: endonuclease, partial [Chloroflexi bacterium]|nr:endonuclease [Chloroflexota bacterium]